MTQIQSITELAAALAGVSDAIAGGAFVDLCGLDAAVADAMRDAASATTAERAALRPALLLLADALDRLAGALARQHHAGAQRRAAVAYGGGHAAPERP